MFELMNFINLNVIFTLPATNYSDTTSSFGQPTIHTLPVIQTKQVVNRLLVIMFYQLHQLIKHCNLYRHYQFILVPVAIMCINNNTRHYVLTNWFSPTNC